MHLSYFSSQQCFKMWTNRTAVGGAEKSRAAFGIGIDPEDREIASVACHFQKGAIPTHTEHQIIASNARELATVEAIVRQPHDFESRLYGCQGALVFLMAVPHGLHDRLAVPLQ